MNKAEELIQYFNNAYGMEKEWPKTFEVSAELYGRCCQAVFNKADNPYIFYGDVTLFTFALGPSRGLIFKNVELIIRAD